MNDDAEPQPAQLPEGDYEVMVVDVGQPLDVLPRPDERQPDDQGQSEERSDQQGQDDAELSLVVLKGPLKGQVVGLRYPPGSGDLLGLLGALGTLVVAEEVLQLRLDD